MACHFSILPADLLQAISGQLGREKWQGEECVFDGGLRFLRLPHPRTGVPTLFLPHENEQTSCILEIQSVSPPNLRSWFLQDEVVEDGTLLVMTPVDPALLLIRILKLTTPGDGTVGNFRPADDIIEEAANKLATSATEDTASITSEDVLFLSSLRCVGASMRRICEFKDITPEIIVYRYSPEKVHQYLRTKVSRLSDPNVSELSRTLNRNLAREGLLEDGKEELLSSARLRAACDLVSQYLPKDVYENLLASYDFERLNAYMKVLKDESMALAAVSMNAVEAKESKETKEVGADTKKRKASKGSYGVEKLKKANVNGMAKLSTFFQKK
ncbi:ribonuclease H2, subunit B [Trametes meyenii]|nr:ribonuclease H2, subunit B [Trametes meyenii]